MTAQHFSWGLMLVLVVVLLALAPAAAADPCIPPSVPTPICSRDGESLFQFYHRLGQTPADFCIETPCPAQDSSSFLFRALIQKDPDNPTMIFSPIVDCEVAFETGAYALVTKTGSPDLCQLQSPRLFLVPALATSPLVANATPVILNPAKVLFSTVQASIPGQCQDQCLRPADNTDPIDMKAICVYHDGESLLVHDYSAETDAADRPAGCPEPPTATLDDIDCAPSRSCYTFECTQPSESGSTCDSPCAPASNFGSTVISTRRPDDSLPTTTELPLAFCSIPVYAFSMGGLQNPSSQTSFYQPQCGNDISESCSTEYSVCLTYEYSTSSGQYSWVFSPGSQCPEYSPDDPDNQDARSKVCAVCSSEETYFDASVGDLYRDITDWNTIKTNFVADNTLLTTVTCTNYAYTPTNSIIHASITHDNCPTSGEPCDVIVKVTMIETPVSVTVTTADNQCKWECSYEASTFTECQTIDNCKSCTLDSRSVPRIIELTDPATIPPNPDACACTVSCSLKAAPEPGPFAVLATVGDELTPSEVTSPCQLNSYRPPNSFCFGSAIDSDTVRDIFCTWSSGGKTYYAGTACGTEGSMTTLQDAQFTPEPEKCETMYVCQMTDDGPDVPCPCPSSQGSPDDGTEPCDSAGVIKAKKSSCEVTYTDGSNEETFTVNVATCCEFDKLDTPGTSAGSSCGCDCLDYEWKCVCKPDGFDAATEIFCGCDSCQGPDCDTIDVTDPDFCSPESSCSVKPVDVRCMKLDGPVTDAAVEDAKCGGQTKPTITTYQCPPTENNPVGSAQCPYSTTADVLCWNTPTQTEEDAYDCATCVDASNTATSRTPICHVQYTDLTRATTEPIEFPAPCSTETIADLSTCVSSPVPVAGSFTRGDAVSFKWTYIGSRPSSEQWTFHPISAKTSGGFVYQIDEPQITVAKSASTLSYTPTTAFAFPYTTKVRQVDPNDSTTLLPSTSSLTIAACDTNDSNCIAKLCAADKMTSQCKNGSSCAYDPTTTFTKCSCTLATKGQFCEFDANCPATPAPCFGNGSPLLGESCTKCHCNDNWSRALCDTCTEGSITALCTAKNYNPSTSSTQCRCDCFYGWAGNTCATRVVYAQVNLNAPPTPLVIGQSWESSLDRNLLTTPEKTVLQSLNRQLATLTAIPSIEVVECRAQQGAGYTYIVRFAQSAPNAAAWAEFVNPSVLFTIQQTAQLVATDPTPLFDPLCTTSCTGTSPYPSRQVPVDCTTDTTNAVCQTSYGTLLPEPGAPEPVDPVTPDPSDEKGSSKTGLIVGLVVGLTLGFILIALLIFFLLKRRGGSGDSSPSTRASANKRTPPPDPFPFEDDMVSASASAPRAPQAPVEPRMASRTSKTPIAPKAPPATKPSRVSTDKKERRSDRETELAAIPGGHKTSGAGRKTQDDSALPVPWKQCTDHLGNLYYINMHTMESTFQRPV